MGEVLSKENPGRLRFLWCGGVTGGGGVGGGVGGGIGGGVGGGVGGPQRMRGSSSSDSLSLTFAPELYEAA